MIRSFFRGIKGCISLLLYILNTASIACIILIFFPIISIIPIKSWRHAINFYFIQRLPILHMLFNRGIMWISTRGKWDIQGTGELKNNGWYVMISNHQSWIDILILGKVFNLKAPPLKFFMKKELLWQLPLAGIACYALGYPFMSRHTREEIRKNPSLKGKDIETTKKSCLILRKYPSTMINFAEGTRFTYKKKERQNSPFKRLLKPKVGGAAIVINELHDILDGVISSLIFFPGKPPSIWQFACGNFEKIYVRYEVIQITPDLVGDYHKDRQFRSHIQQWLNSIWEKNDKTIDSFSKQ